MTKKDIRSYSDIDASDDAKYWVELMKQFTKMPFVIEVRKTMLDWIKQFNPQNLLDAGCGTGDTTRQLADAFPAAKQIIGMDYSKEMLVYAESQKNPHNVIFSKGDITKLDFKDESFDVVRIERVLHHVEAVEDAFKEINRVLKPGGHLVIYEPDFFTLRLYPYPEHLLSILSSRVSASVAHGDIGCRLHELVSKKNFSLIHRKLIANIWDDYKTINECSKIIKLANEILTEKDQANFIEKIDQSIKDQLFYLMIPGYLYCFKKRN